MAKAKHSSSNKYSNSGSSISPSTFRERKYFFEFLVFGVSFLVFANSIFNDYNLDDELVTINHRLTAKGIAAIPEIFSSPYYQDQSGYAYEYRPIVLASFAIEHDLFGDNPHWSHFWNVILYSLTCVVLYKLLRKILKDNSYVVPLFVTLLFSIHTSHTEVVCSIKNRDEILGLLFGLLCFHSAINTLRTGSKVSMVLVSVFFTLSLLSKITFISFAVIVPISLLIFETFSFKWFIAITISLLLPAIVLADVGSSSNRLFILLLGVIAVVIVALTQHAKQILHTSRKMIATLLNKNNYSLNDSQVAEVDSQKFWSQVVSPFKEVTLPFLSGFILITIIYAIAVYYSYYNLQIALTLLLLPLFFARNEKLKWGATVIAFVFISIRSSYLQFMQLDLFHEILTLPLIYFVLSKHKSLFLPSILLILISTTANVVLSHSSTGIFFVLMLIASMKLQRFKFGWLAAVISVVMAFPGFPLSITAFIESETSPVLTSILLLSIYFKKGEETIAKLFVVGLLIASLFIHPQQNTQVSIVGKLVNTANQVNIQVKPINDNRPINYVENCIDFRTSSLSVRAGTAFEILLNYLQKTAVPFPLSFYYGYSVIYPMELSHPVALLSIGLHLGLLLLAFYFLRRSKLISLGLFIYLIAIVGISNYFTPIPGMMADRFLLIPTLGFSLFFVGLLSYFLGESTFGNWTTFKIVPNKAKVPFFALFSFYSLLTFQRNFDWKDHLTLYRKDIKHVENSAQAHNLLAITLMKNAYNVPAQEQSEMHLEALQHFKKAVAIYPPFFNATYDVGRVYSIMNLQDSALRYYLRVIRLNPMFTDAYIAAGDIYFQKGELDSARVKYEETITVFPQLYFGYDKVSYIYFMQKKYEESLIVNRKAMINISNDPQPFIAIAKTFHAINQDDSARYYLQRAIALSPTHQEANALLQNLGSR